jgi:hypothetical protein
VQRYTELRAPYLLIGGLGARRVRLPAGPLARAPLFAAASKRGEDIGGKAIEGGPIARDHISSLRIGLGLP